MAEMDTAAGTGSPLWTSQQRHTPPAAGALNVRAHSMRLAHDLCRAANLWPAGAAGELSAPARIAALYGVTLVPAHLADSDCLGMLIYSLRCIIVNTRFCPRAVLEQGRSLDADLHYQVVALALLSAFVLEPAHTEVLLLPARWEQYDAYAALWHSIWAMALEILLPTPYLVGLVHPTIAIRETFAAEALWPSLPSLFVHTKHQAVRAYIPMPVHPQFLMQFEYWEQACDDPRVADAAMGIAWGSLLRSGLRCLRDELLRTFISQEDTQEFPVPPSSSQPPPISTGPLS